MYANGTMLIFNQLLKCADAAGMQCTTLIAAIAKSGMLPCDHTGLGNGRGNFIHLIGKDE